MIDNHTLFVVSVTLTAILVLLLLVGIVCAWLTDRIKGRRE